MHKKCSKTFAFDSSHITKFEFEPFCAQYAHPDSDVCEETTTIPAAKALGHYVASGHYVENGVNYYGAVSGWVNVSIRLCAPAYAALPC